jgi:hypothetical protein
MYLVCGVDVDIMKYEWFMKITEDLHIFMHHSLSIEFSLQVMMSLYIRVTHISKASGIEWDPQLAAFIGTMFRYCCCFRFAFSVGKKCLYSQKAFHILG